jgi:hypothetical protein
VHRADDAELLGDLAEVRQQFADPPPLSWRFQRNIDGAIGKRFWPEVIPVSRWPERTESGRSRSYHSVRFGLWSNRSSWLGPPSMCR